MFKLKDHIFNLFGNYDREIDKPKVNGKGILERINESIGWDFDDEVFPLIEFFVLKHRVAADMHQDHLYNAALSSGNDELFLTNDLSRRIQKFIFHYFAVRGSLRGYECMLALLGLKLTLTEHHSSFSFDFEAPVTLDWEFRTFDQHCQPCSDYSVDLTRVDGSSAGLTDEEKRLIGVVIKFNEPINARLRTTTFEGNPINLGEYNSDYNNDYNIS